MKIFKFGSCRTSVQGYINNHSIEYNYDLTHTSKEILMYLNIFDGSFEFKKIPNIDCLMRNPKNFNLRRTQSDFNSSDIILIEISSIKIVENEGFFYQIVRYNENSPIDKFQISLQKEDDFFNDVTEIYQRIKKPIIFVPHITMDFDRETKSKNGENYVLKNETLTETRKLIENFIVNNTKIHIKTSEIFKDYHYSEICDCSKKFDPNHYTKFGYELISKKIEETVEKIKNDIL